MALLTSGPWHPQHRARADKTPVGCDFTCPVTSSVSADDAINGFSRLTTWSAYQCAMGVCRDMIRIATVQLSAHVNKSLLQT